MKRSDILPVSFLSWASFPSRKEWLGEMLRFALPLLGSQIKTSLIWIWKAFWRFCSSSLVSGRSVLLQVGLQDVRVDPEKQEPFSLWLFGAAPKKTRLLNSKTTTCFPRYHLLLEHRACSGWNFPLKSVGWGGPACKSSKKWGSLPALFFFFLKATENRTVCQV